MTKDEEKTPFNGYCEGCKGYKWFCTCFSKENEGFDTPYGLIAGKRTYTASISVEIVDKKFYARLMETRKLWMDRLEEWLDQL